jgi:hypothetical protein
VGLSAVEVVARVVPGRGGVPLAAVQMDGAWSTMLERVATELVPLGARPREVAVVVSNDIAQHWLCSAPIGVSSLQELRVYAEMRRVQLHGGASSGEEASSWRLEGDWRAGGAFACSALPAALVAQAERLATALGASLRLTTELGQVLPHAGRQSPKQDNGWRALTSDSRAALWRVDRHGLVQLRVWQLLPSFTRKERGQAVADEVHREVLRAGVSAPAGIAWRDAVCSPSAMLELPIGAGAGVPEVPLGGRLESWSSARWAAWLAEHGALSHEEASA